MNAIAGLMLSIIVLCLLAAGFLYWAGAVSRQRQRASSLEALARRADINGKRLLQLIRTMRDMAAIDASPVRKAQMRGWAAEVEALAVQHLECINAISIEALQACTDKPVHLGDFKPAMVERRRNPPLSGLPSILVGGRHG